jgi:DNA-binding transcriptional ArsR family regulator
MQSATLDAVFAALADPTRRAIHARLADGDASVNELAEPFAMSQPAISKHLKVLERAGLVSHGIDAQRRPRKLEPARLEEANAWLEGYRQLWEARFEKLDALLEVMKREASAASGKPGSKTKPKASRSGGSRSASNTNSGARSRARTTRPQPKRKR